MPGIEFKLLPCTAFFGIECSDPMFITPSGSADEYFGSRHIDIDLSDSECRRRRVPFGRLVGEVRDSRLKSSCNQCATKFSTMSLYVCLIISQAFLSPLRMDVVKFF